MKKKMVIALAIASFVALGLRAEENRSSVWTSLLTREVPAGCRVDACPPPCKNSVCCDDSAFGGYVFAYGGGSFLNSDFSQRLFPGNNPFSIHTGDGFIMGGGVGLRTGLLGGSRVELEHLYSQLPVDSAVAVLGGALAAGDVSYTGTFINALKEIYFECLPCVTAYFGGGIGWATVAQHWIPIGGLRTNSDNDTALSFQLAAGADYNLCDNIALFLQCKAINIGETSYNVPARVATIENFWTHSVVAGLRFSF